MSRQVRYPVAARHWAVFCSAPPLLPNGDGQRRTGRGRRPPGGLRRRRRARPLLPVHAERRVDDRACRQHGPPWSTGPGTAPSCTRRREQGILAGQRFDRRGLPPGHHRRDADPTCALGNQATPVLVTASPRCGEARSDPRPGSTDSPWRWRRPRPAGPARRRTVDHAARFGRAGDPAAATAGTGRPGRRPPADVAARAVAGRGDGSQTMPLGGAAPRLEPGPRQR